MIVMMVLMVVGLTVMIIVILLMVVIDSNDDCGVENNSGGDTIGLSESRVNCREDAYGSGGNTNDDGVFDVDGEFNT